MNKTEENLKIAEEYYEKGMKLFSQRDYPDAAEKIWGSVKSATTALTERYLGRTTPEEGEYWREFVARAFIKAGVTPEEAKSRAEYFINVRDRLHGGCFYGSFYEEIEHKPLIDEAREYLNDIRKILKVSSLPF